MVFQIIHIIYIYILQPQFQAHVTCTLYTENLFELYKLFDIW